LSEELSEDNVASFFGGEGLLAAGENDSFGQSLVNNYKD
jgi:hypothetical protein